MLADLAPRFGLVVLVTALVLAPVHAVLGSLRLVEDPAAGLRVLPAPLPGLYRLLLVGAALVLWEGIVSVPRRDGTFRFLFCRPASRAAFCATGHMARMSWLVCYGIGLAWVLGGPGGRELARGASTALAAGGFAGGLTLLASVLVDRGDALAVAAVLVLGRAARLGDAAVTAPLGSFRSAAAAVLKPVADLDATMVALAACHRPGVAGGLSVLIVSAVTLGLALRLVDRQELGG